MAIDTTIYVRSPGVGSALFDWIQMLTGVGLITFMWSHMILVASVNLGAGAMDTLAHFLEATYMAQVGGFPGGATIHDLETRPNTSSFGYMALDHPGRHCHGYSDYGIDSYVDRTHRPPDHSRQKRSENSRRILAGFLSYPAPHGGTSRGDRILSYWSEMGFYQTKQPEGVEEI